MLFASPERHANRAPRPDTDRLQQPRRLHHRGAPDRVVSGAGGAVPRIEVPAQHHDLIAFVSSGNLGDRVVRRVSVRIGGVGDVELERDGRAVGKNARHTAVVFIAHHDRGNHFRDVIRRIVERRDLAELPSGIVDAQCGAVRQQKLVDAPIDLRPRHGRKRGLRLAATATLRGIRIRIVASAKSGVVDACRPRFEPGCHGDGAAGEHDLPFDLCADAVQIGGELCRRRPVRWRQLKRLRRDGSFRAGRPGQDFNGQLVLDRRNHVRGDVLVGPARMAKLPRFEVSVLKSPAGHGLDGPFGGRLGLRRTGQPRPVHIAQVVHRPHDLGVRLFFLTKGGVDFGRPRRLGAERHQQHGKEHEPENPLGHGIDCKRAAFFAEGFGLQTSGFWLGPGPSLEPEAWSRFIGRRW